MVAAYTLNNASTDDSTQILIYAIILTLMTVKFLQNNFQCLTSVSASA